MATAYSDYQNFTVATDADGIALVIWDSPGKSMNVLDRATSSELAALVEQTTADAAITGVVITSGKEAFSGGADLTMLADINRVHADMLKDKGEIAANQFVFDKVCKLSQSLRNIETCGKPWVAAINGLALGGAFELVLACHHRVAADNPRTRLGLPEVKLGLFPGGGGTQRLPRLIPMMDAVQLLLKGDSIDLAKAAALGIVATVVPPAELITAAKDWIKTGGEAVAPWDEKGFRLPGGPVHAKSGMNFFPAANAILRRETHDNFPAARAILQCVYEGLQLPIDTALRVKLRYFSRILRSNEAAAMIRSLFVSMGELNKGARRPRAVPPATVRKVAVIGAGFMGASVGLVSARAGIDVVLVDRDQASAERGKAHAAAAIEVQMVKGRIARAQGEAVLGRITATADYAAIGDCDLVIEAVFEDRRVKAETYARAQPLLREGAIFASNTSTLPINSLAEAWEDQSRFIGIHFFSPVEKMMLVEIIVGSNTGDLALATALDYVRQIKKTPIVVNDSRGFFANRCVQRYLAEGYAMFGEGIPPAMIENVARMAGMPVGPLALTDEVAIDLSLQILRATEADLGSQAVEPLQKRLLTEMVEKHGRLGRKNAKGFYDYPEKGGAGKKRLWPELATLQPLRLDPDGLDIEELKQRFLVAQAVEAARTLEDGVITDPREADVGSILGFGFPPFTGGALSYIDFMGVSAFVDLCRKLEGKYGPRFAPPQLLFDMAANDQFFYATPAADGLAAVA